MKFDVNKHSKFFKDNYKRNLLTCYYWKLKNIIVSQSEVWKRARTIRNLHSWYNFPLVLHENTLVFSQSEVGNFFSCILLMMWNVNDSEQIQKSYLPSKSSKTFRIRMNHITPLENGNRRPLATHNHLLWSSLYLWRHKHAVFSEWWNRIKKLRYYFSFKRILLKSRERTKFKHYRSKTEK